MHNVTIILQKIEHIGVLMYFALKSILYHFLNFSSFFMPQLCNQILWISCFKQIKIVGIFISDYYIRNFKYIYRSVHKVELCKLLSLKRVIKGKAFIFCKIVQYLLKQGSK